MRDAAATTASASCVSWPRHKADKPGNAHLQGPTGSRLRQLGLGQFCSERKQEPSLWWQEQEPSMGPRMLWNIVFRCRTYRNPIITAVNPSHGDVSSRVCKASVSRTNVRQDVWASSVCFPKFRLVPPPEQSHNFLQLATSGRNDEIGPIADSFCLDPLATAREPRVL